MSGLRGRLVDVGGVIYDYDGDGFLKKKTDGSDVTEYAYSSRGELLNVTLPGGRAVAYVHDPLGRRIAKKVGGTVVEKYLWQGLTRLLAVFDGNNALIMRFEYADARMPVAMTKAGTTYYLGYDQAGSLKAVADASGNVIKKIEYDSFGNIINGTNPNFAVPFGFAGGLYDRDTGLVRFGYRDYDPETGRWTAKDPILFAGGDTDLYGYCVSDPVNLLDPEGLDAGVLSGPATGILLFAAIYWATLPPEQKEAMADDLEKLWNENSGGAGSPCPPPEDPCKKSRLKRLHSDETTMSSNKSSYDFWSGKETWEIIESLEPGTPESLIEGV